MRRLFGAFVFLGVFLGLLISQAIALGPEDVPKITVHELKEKLDEGEKVIILDMRVGGSYTKSSVRIKNDVRMPLQYVDMRAKELPIGYEIVTYCT
jgi:hypothetical protein